MDFHVSKIWKILKHFARAFHQAYTFYFWGVETNMLAIGMAVAVMNLNTIIKKYERGENMQSLYFLFLKKCTKMMKSLFFFIITISLFLSGGIFLKKKWNIQVNIHQNEVINNNFLNKSRTLSTYFFFENLA